MQLQIDPDIRRASTPPAAFYTSMAWFERLLPVFEAAWHLVVEPPMPGECVPFAPMDGLLRAPLVLTCSEQGQRRAVSNSCTHRGATLVSERCSQRLLRCPYHGRSFELDGQLRRAPGFGNAADFPRSEDHLSPATLASALGLSFVSLAPLQPLEHWLAPVLERCGHLPWQALRLDPGGTRDWPTPANWMLYVDNYLEGLHIPFVHPGLNRVLDPADYRYELLPTGTLQIGLARDGSPTLQAPRGHADHGQPVAAYYFWLFPNLMLNVYPWGVSVNRVLPRAPGETIVRYHRLVWDADLLGQGAGGDLDTVEQEDQAVVLATWQGLQSRHYTTGRYSPDHEQGVHHFHRMLLEAIDG